MNSKELFDKAYSRLVKLYASDHTAPNAVILSRFYREKMFLADSTLYMRYLDFSARVRSAAKARGEHAFTSGTVGASLVAYLLGATDINPLPRHEYCPHCHKVNFTGVGLPIETHTVKCSCGAEIQLDGYGIPFESNLTSVLSNRIQIRTSHAFFDDVKRMIFDEMWDKSIVTLKDKERSLAWFCILDKETNESGEYTLNGNSDLFFDYPRITVIKDSVLDKYREIESATGFKMSDIGPEDQSLVASNLLDGNTQVIPFYDNKFIKETLKTVRVQSYDDIFKVIGFALSSNVWRENAEYIYRDQKKPLAEIPTYREELYMMIREHLYHHGIHDDGLAYEVMEKAWHGHYSKAGEVDEYTALSLQRIGFDVDFIAFLEKINYMPSKAQGVGYLRWVIAMMYYNLKYNEEYSAIMPEKCDREDD